MKTRFIRFRPLFALLTIGFGGVSGAAVIDGVNDFLASETYATSGGPSHTGYASLSSTYLHFGFDSPEITTGGSSHFAIAYAGTVGGSTPGVNFNTQQPTINFSATLAFIHRLDDGYNAVLAWNGSSWNASSITVSTIEAGNFFEAAVDAGDIGSPAQLAFVSYMLYEGSGFESSYNVFPSDSFVNATYDPNISSFLTLSIPEPTTPLLGLLGIALLLRRRR
jgi:hypothetical protein